MGQISKNSTVLIKVEYSMLVISNAEKVTEKYSVFIKVKELIRAIFSMLRDNSFLSFVINTGIIKRCL